MMSRVPGLDGIRGFAVALVLLFHGVGGTMQPLYEPHRYNWNGMAALILKVTEPLSGGVEIFFVLSGFLITFSLLNVRQLDADAIRRFYVRRWARVAPLYWLVLLVLLLAGYSLYFLSLSALFLMNFAPLLSVDSDWLPIWSISVEVQFYLVWPILLYLVGRRHLLKICLAVVFLSPLFRVIGIQHELDTYSITFFRLDGLALGSAFALVIFDQPLGFLESIRKPLWLCLGSFFVIVFFFPDLLDRQTWGGRVFSYEVWQFLALSLIGFSFQLPRVLRWLDARVLRKTGEWSYGIFLFHPMLFYVTAIALRRWGPTQDPRAQLWFVFAQAFFIYFMTFILAWLSYEYFERPLYRRFAQRPR